MAVNSETEINLKTLQRVDSNIVEIIDNASQVAIYKYERKLNKWEGTDIEGTLFLYKRSLYPFHGFIIVNRMSTTNFVESITSDMEFLLQEPYFLYKKSCGEIIGSWFYEDRDFRRITNKIQSIVLKQAVMPKRQRCSSDGDSCLKKDEVVQDIMSLLSEAHTEYIKTEMDNLNDKKRIEDDFNSLSTYADKKINNKIVNLSEKKTKSPCTRSSSEKECVVSPRRRFLSSRSCDSTYSQPFIQNGILNMLVNKSKNMNVSQDFTNKLLTEDNFYQSNHSISTSEVKREKLSTCLPSFGKNDNLLSNAAILEQTEETQEVKVPSMGVNHLLHFNKSTSDEIPYFKNATDKKSKNLVHSCELKDTLMSHLKTNPNFMLKIHEAYVSSLKSVFTQKRS